jgi:arsenate reductase (thioredoxin)
VVEKIRVLFVCIHNSARSQMAEAFLNGFGSDNFFAESAGIEPGTLNPMVVKAMAEIGYDISNNKTKSVFDYHKQGRAYDYVITVCDPEAAERCPVFPGKVKRLHWGFRDPSTLTGTDPEKMKEIRIIRDRIKEAVIAFIKEISRIEKENLS